MKRVAGDAVLGETTVEFIAEQHVAQLAAVVLDHRPVVLVASRRQLVEVYRIVTDGESVASSSLGLTK